VLGVGAVDVKPGDLIRICVTFNIRLSAACDRLDADENSLLLLCSSRLSEMLLIVF